VTADVGEGGEVLGLETLEVDLGDGVDAEAAAENVATEIVGASLAATLLKAETWGISCGGGCARGARGGRGSRRRAPRRGRPRVWGVCIESGQANRGMRPGGTGRGEREPGGDGVEGATAVGEIRGSTGGTLGAVEACKRGHRSAICGLDLVDLASRKEREPISRRAAMDESRRCGGGERDATGERGRTCTNKMWTPTLFT
jgi:hypothetical protein